jgi:hypothetical protein
LLWRPHTHAFFPRDKRQFVVFVLSLLKRVFPKADRYVREMLVTRIMTAQWFEHKWGAVPQIDLAAPWKILQKPTTVT